MRSLVESPEVLVEVFLSTEAVTTSSIAKMQILRIMVRLVGFRIPGDINQISLRNFNPDRLLNHLDFDCSF